MKVEVQKLESVPTFSFDEFLANPGIYQVKSHDGYYQVSLGKNTFFVYSSGNPTVFTKNDAGGWDNHRFILANNKIVLSNN